MFYCFSQNNSGGRFVFNDKLTHYVIIEAPNKDAANGIAKGLGIYFEGVYEGIDCSCCGDRWNEVSESDGKKEPKIYDTSVADYHKQKYAHKFMKGGEPEIYVHTLDGKITEYWK